MDSVGLYNTALFQQLVQRLAAHLVPGRAGQEAQAPLLCVHRDTGGRKGGAAGLVQCTLNSGQRVLLGGLRLVSAVNVDPVARIIGSGQLDAAILDASADGVLYRHPLQFSAEQLAGFGRGGAGGRSVSLGADAEHPAVVMVGQVAVGEAGPGEDVPHQLFIIGLALPHGTAGGHRGGGVFGRAQTALDLGADHTGVHQFPDVGNIIHIFQAQVAGFAGLAGAQARAGIKGQAAGACAGAAVAAASA